MGNLFWRFISIHALLLSVIGSSIEGNGTQTSVRDVGPGTFDQRRKGERSKESHAAANKGTTTGETF